MEKTKFKRRMFAVAAIVGMGMTMTQIAFGKESFNAENGGLNYVLPADNGYYFLCGGHLYFWNGDVTKQAVPLCSRPNCSHTTEDCVAMIRDASRKMYEVDDGFYVLSTWPREDSRTGEKMMPIWRVEKDGSGKEIIAEIPEAGSVNYTIFQDKIYYTMEDAQEDGNYQFSIWQMSLDGKDNKQIWQSDLYSGYIDTLQGIGDWLYVSENGCEEIIDWTNEDNIDFEKLPMRTNLYLYQPQAEEWITNPDEYKKEDVLSMGCGSGIMELQLENKVVAIDDNKVSIHDATENAKRLELDNKLFIAGHVNDQAAHHLKNHSYDALIINETVDGMTDDLLKSITLSGIKHVIIVSDNMSTLAKTLHQLEEMFDVNTIISLDKEPHTPRLEIIVDLKRK